ncbi:MAG: deoxyribonuclease-2 [Chlamydiales bacterium]|jgi:deoxyribonuclease-2
MLQALNDLNASAVDWWFIYKMPDNIGPDSDTKGDEYLYYDPETGKGLTKSDKVLDKGQSALDVTLEQVFNSKGMEDGNSYILYNDEKPDSDKNRSSCGHCKGILAFNKKNNTGFYLLHSTPRYPLDKKSELPSNELIYGQTYICVTLPDYETANRIAEVLRTQHEPQVYTTHLSEDITKDESVYKLGSNNNTPEPEEPTFISFKSKAGKEFQLAGKNRKWGKDFWIDLIGPHLGVSLNVESWRRGASPGNEDSDGKDETLNAQNIDFTSVGLKDYTFHYTKDHSKWGVSTDAANPWVCIADINRMVSQEKRGGGALIFQEEQLWKNLKSVENTDTK